MKWLRANLNVGHIIIIVTIVIGFVSTQAVRVYSGEKLSETVEEHGDDIELNSDFRKQGFPFTHEKELELATSFQHAINDDVHMPFAEKVKVFVPRTEFEDVKRDVKDLKTGQADIMKLLLERLPK